MHRNGTHRTCNVQTHCPRTPQAVLGVATFLGEVNESGGIFISALQCKGQVWADLEGSSGCGRSQQVLLVQKSVLRVWSPL